MSQGEPFADILGSFGSLTVLYTQDLHRDMTQVLLIHTCIEVHEPQTMKHDNET